MEFSTVNKLLKGFSIPLQPMVVSKLLRLMPDLEAISEVIQQDPSLTGSVLKLANYKQQQPQSNITSVEQAVQLLGLKGITSMVNVQLLRKASIEGLQESALSDFWKINNDVAFACGLMARQLNLAAVDDAYYLGLFHNIGMPVMWQKHPEYFDFITRQPIDSDSEVNLLKAENDEFDCSHSSVGFFVARGMSLNMNVCEAIRLHHDTTRVFESSESNHQIISNLSLLKASEYILGEVSVLHGRANDYEWQLIKHSVIEELGLSELDFHDLEDILKEETLMRDGF